MPHSITQNVPPAEYVVFTIELPGPGRVQWRRGLWRRVGSCCCEDRRRLLSCRAAVHARLVCREGTRMHAARRFQDTCSLSDHHFGGHAPMQRRQRTGFVRKGVLALCRPPVESDSGQGDDRWRGNNQPVRNVPADPESTWPAGTTKPASATGTTQNRR